MRALLHHDPSGELFEVFTEKDLHRNLETGDCDDVTDNWFAEELFKEQQKGNQARESENEMKLEIAVLAGAESKQFLVDLAKLVERMEKATGGTSVKTDAAATTTTKKAAPATKAAKGFDDEDDETTTEETSTEETSEGEDDENDFATPPAKKAATKKAKLTVDDVNDACKARAAVTGGKAGRAEVLALLNKHFKATSVLELKPEQFEKAISVMAVK